MAETESKLDFDAWWLELRAIAAADPYGDSAGPDKESFREMWADAMTPEEAYYEVWSDMRR